MATETTETYGRLTVIGEAGVDKWGNRRLSCRCECGNLVEVLRSSLISNRTSNRTRSCGCLLVELNSDILKSEMPARLAEVQSMRADGKTLQEIGTRFNLSRQRVCQLLDPNYANKISAQHKARRKKIKENQRLGGINDSSNRAPIIMH